MYRFYLDEIAFPIAPPKLQMKVKNQNKTLVLLNEGEINIPRLAGLMEISFQARLPQQPLPFAPNGRSPADYMALLGMFKAQKKKLRFLVTRSAPDGTLLFDTNLLVTLEDYTVTEDAGEGFDMLADLQLKEYREYGVKTIRVNTGKPSAQVSRSRPASTVPNALLHKVSRGGTLWAIAQQHLGDGSRYKEIYELNRTTIDGGNRGTGNTRNTVYPGQTLRMPQKTPKKWR